MKRKTLKRKVKRRMNNKNYKRKRKEKKSTRKYVGGFGTSFDNLPCSILQTEINHDLRAALTQGNQKDDIESPEFNKNVAKNKAGECKNHQPDRTGPRQGFYSFHEDLEFLERITDKTVDGLKAYTTPVDIPITSRSVTINQANNGYLHTEVNPTARVIFKSKNDRNTFDNTLFELFGNIQPVNDENTVNDENIQPVNDENRWIDIFFVIDTGDNLVQLLKGLTPNPEHRRKYRFHIIHSVYTLGDSAWKTLPNGSKYKCRNPNVHIYSWLFTDNPSINPLDPIFMTSYKIKCTILQDWKVDQFWSWHGQGAYNTQDSKKDNNKKKVIEEMKSRHVKHEDNHLSIQKKRSGDYFQIKFAKKLPRYMNNQRNLDLQVSNNEGAKLFSNKDDLYSLGYTLAQYRDRTFFITGDWPAFSYALFNKINSIIFAKHPTDITKCGFLSASINP